MQGSMKTVTDCLLTLKAQFMPNVMGDGFSITSPTTKSDNQSTRGLLSPLSVEERRKVFSESKFQRALRSPVMSGMVNSLVQIISVVHGNWLIDNSKISFTL